MTFIDTVMLYFSTIACALMLVAGGWAKIRNWFKVHEQAKMDAAEAAAKARADEVETAVQERLKTLQNGSNVIQESMVSGK